jgi:hypothetical protein
MLFGIFPLSAAKKYVKSESPVFPEVEPDRALVYFVRGGDAPPLQGGTFKVLLDETPIGHLGRRTYIAVQVEPGRHIAWGPKECDPTWFEFRAGYEYLVRLTETWSIYSYQSNSQTITRVDHQSTSWNVSDSEGIKSIVRTEKLTHLTPTDSGLSKLRKEVAKKFEEVKLAAGAPPAVTPESIVMAPLPLPQTFEEVLYRPEKRGFGLTVWKARGTFMVSEEGLDFLSEDENLAIPVESIRSVYTGKLGADQLTTWMIVEYDVEGTAQIAGFAARHFEPQRTQRIHATVDSAVDTFRLPPIERVEQAVAAAEAFEAMAFMRTSDIGGWLQTQEESQNLRFQLHAVDSLLSDHLERVPDDLGALFLQVRLDRLLMAMSPVVISDGEQAPADPLGPKRDPLRTLERILEIDPDNPLAFYSMARVYAMSDPLTGEEHDLDKAIHFATRAVAGDPQNPAFSETLAILQVLAGREAEARQVFVDTGAIGHDSRLRHPTSRVLWDRSGSFFHRGSMPREMGRLRAEGDGTRKGTERNRDDHAYGAFRLG